ncbi:MAG: 30S ribosome-binding factor RbfA [Bacteroidales bacterium]|jgi:ribosome-binding factor A|nr:30S ribosome-binding factor RbfA [Bacteroidales bacterium]
METTRQQKVNSLLQKDLADILLREVIIPNTMISVTRVNITPDMSVARVNLSVFATKDKAAVVKQVQAKKSEIRHLLGERIKRQVRIVPDLQFFLDDSLDRIERIDELLKQS